MQKSCECDYSDLPADPDNHSIEKSAQPGDKDLLLDIYKNNFSKEEVKRCPNAKFYADLVFDDEARFKRSRIRCKSWNCPYCGKINSWVLKKRIEKAVLGLYGEMVDSSIDPLHCFKFLTLTAPGVEYRALKTAGECEKEMKKSFKNLMGILKRKFGNEIQYIWACEKQKDGYPHLHVLLVGEAIKPISVKKVIEDAWRGRYGMGFVRINSAFKNGLQLGEDFDRLVHYLTKYISKEMVTGLKGYRVFSMSRKTKTMSMMEKRNVTVVAFGRITSDENGEESFEEIWKVGEALTITIKEEMEKALVDEIGDWFDLQVIEMKKGIQLKLPIEGEQWE